MEFGTMKYGRDLLAIVAGLALATGGLIVAVKLSLFDLGTMPRYVVHGSVN